MALYHLYRKFPLKRSIVLPFKYLQRLRLTCLSHINGKVFLKTLDFKKEKLQKHQVEVVISLMTGKSNITSVSAVFELLICVPECMFIRE